MAKLKSKATAQSPTVLTAPEPLSTDELDRRLGYAGSIQLGPICSALDEQREALWLAQSIVDTTVGAIERQYGKDWLASVPDFPRALREASRLINTVAGNLESGVLEDRGLAIARAEEASHED